MFINVISNLTEHQKTIVKKLGFGSLLKLSCLTNVNEIFHWLARHFDTTSGTVMLEDGFSFTISPNFVFKILGIPFGGNTIELKSGK
jgi:hypothetical protein